MRERKSRLTIDKAEPQMRRPAEQLGDRLVSSLKLLYSCGMLTLAELRAKLRALDMAG